MPPPPPSTPPRRQPSAVWLDAAGTTVEEQLALDEAVLEAQVEFDEAMPSATIVRVWEPRETVVVVGSSSRLDEEVDREACRRLGVGIVRRPSGGATVVIGPGCLMWSVVERYAEGTPPVDRLHVRFLEPLRAAIADRGCVAERKGTSDLAVDGRKFSGNALRVKKTGVLYHGTLLDAFDLDLVGRLLRHPPREPEYRAGREHGSFLVNLGLGAAPLVAAVREAFGVKGTWKWDPGDRLERLLACRYRQPEWTARL